MAHSKAKSLYSNLYYDVKINLIRAGDNDVAYLRRSDFSNLMKYAIRQTKKYTVRSTTWCKLTLSIYNEFHLYGLHSIQM